MRIAHCMVLAAGMMLGGCGVQNLWRDGTRSLRRGSAVARRDRAGRKRSSIRWSRAMRPPGRLQREYDNRRALRALKCLLDKPSMFESAADIRKKVEPACLGAAGRGAARWAQGARLRILLTLPALRPLPAEPPKFIATTDVPSVYGMADAAPILVVARDRKLEVLDAGNGQTLYRDAALPERPIFLAPLAQRSRLRGARVRERRAARVRDRRSARHSHRLTARSHGSTRLPPSSPTSTSTSVRCLTAPRGRFRSPKGMTTYTGTIVRVAPLRCSSSCRGS